MSEVATIAKPRADRSADRRRKPVNLSLPIHMVDEAKSCGLNLSQAAENGIKRALDEKLKVEYQKHFDHWNADMAENGLPLEKDILF